MLHTSEIFDRIFNLAPVLFAVSTIHDGKYLSVNKKFLNTLGYAEGEIIGRSSAELNIFVDYADREKAMSVILQHGSISNFESRIKTKTGTILTVLFSGELIEINGVKYLLSVCVDISAERDNEKRLAYFDRLNIIGETAAAIAHEIRNPLTTVRGFLQLQQMKNPGPGSEYYCIIIDELDRANSIISEYLAYAKDSESQFERKNLNSIIRAIYPLIQSDALKGNKYVQLELGELPELMLNSKEIKQLIFNISRNGLEAMKDKGCLCIRTYVELTEIILEITDSGPGLPAEILAKLGEPFLTTKTNGNGLGLFVCYKIASKHNALLEVNSSSTGTTFRVRFRIV